MGRDIWIPEGMSDAAVEIFIDIEYARAQLQVVKRQYRGMHNSLLDVCNTVDQLKSMVGNLRKSKNIVSLSEYKNIQSTLKRARLLESQQRSALKNSEEKMLKLDREIQSMAKKLKRLEESNILEFKRGRKKSRT